MQVENEFDAAVLSDEVRCWQPEWGIVLGSGLGAFVEQADISHTVPFSEIHGLPTSDVPGHAGRFVFAKIADCHVLIAQGRAHLYEGYTAHQVSAGVRFMGSLGVRRLILTNAAGTLNKEFAPGAWMMLTDHLNLTGTTPLLGGANFFDMTEIYSERLRAVFAQVARKEKIELRQGVYAGLLGPQYETPAEVRMLRMLGADAVGMSTVIEAIQARALGIEVAAFSCLTNWAAGLTKSSLSHAEVLKAGLLAAGDLRRLIARACLAAGRE